MLDWLQNIGLQHEVLGNTVQQWLVAAGTVVAAWIVLRLAVAVVAKRLDWLSQRTSSEWDNVLPELVRGTRSWFLFLVALYAGSLLLTLPAKTVGVIASITVIALIFQVALWANRVLEFAISLYVKRKMETDAAAVTTVTALGFLGKLAIWSVVLLLVLDNVGVDVTALVAGLGVGGIAVALAAQNILGDLFASLSIVLDKPFALGDFIVVGDFLGNVEHIGLKTTRVRSLSGEQLVFANNDLLQSRIRNFKRMQERRILFSLGVTYQTPADKLAAIPQMIREAIESQERTRFDRAHFKEFGDSALNFEVVYYMQVPDYNSYMDTQQAINLNLFRRFETEAIEFAYPTQTLYIEKLAQQENGD